MDDDILQNMQNVQIEHYIDGSRNINMNALENTFPKLVQNSTMFVKNIDRVITFLSRNECFLATPLTNDLLKVGVIIKIRICTMNKCYWLIAEIKKLIYKPSHGYVITVDRDLENGELYLYGSFCEAKTLDVYQTLAFVLDTMQQLGKRV